MNGGRIPLSVTAICETLKICCLVGKTLYERRFGVPFKGPVIPYRISPNDCVNSTLKSCQVCSLDTLCTRGIWKVDITVADTEDLEQMDASELHTKTLNAEEVLTPMKGENFIFPVADGRVKHFWRRSGSENVHLDLG